MADNIPIAGGYVVGTKEIGGVHYQKTTPVDQTGAEISPATAAKQDAAVTELEAQTAIQSGVAEVVGAAADPAYSGVDASIAAMIRAIADAAISQDPAVTKGAPVASYKSSAVDESEDLVSNSPCTINDIFLFNPGSATGYFKIYDADDVADVIVGTTVPLRTYPLGAGKAMHPTGLNIACNNGIVIAATLNYADSDTTAPQTDMVVNIGYRA